MKVKMKTLKEYLKDTIDLDVAQFYLGYTLGIYDDDSMDSFRNHKGTFWTKNPLGEFLANTLFRMADLNIIEFDKEELTVKWIDDR